MPSLQDIRQQWQDKYFADIPFTLSREHYQTAIDDLFRFLELPTDTKKRFSSRLNPDDRGSEIGYQFRSQNEGQLDQKEYFHFNRYAADAFAEHRQSCAELDALMRSAELIYLEAEATMRQLVAALEPIKPGITSDFFPQGKHPKCFLRLLKYDYHREDDFLAKGHYDRGFLTLAIAESAPGLRIGKNPDSLRIVERQPDTVLFMPALRASEFHPDIEPAWHDVIQRQEDALNEKVARWAIVFFSDPYWDMGITFEEAHTPKY